MRPVDVRNLIRFNTRMGMYICPSDRAGVVAFLHGYEHAAGVECQFTAALSKHLAKRHRLRAGLSVGRTRSRGWRSGGPWTGWRRTCWPVPRCSALPPRPRRRTRCCT